MSIRSRLVMLVAILVATTAIILVYLAAAFLDTRQRLAEADAALREFEFAVNTGANIARLRVELLGDLAGDRDGHHAQFDHFAVACEESFEGWLASTEASVHVGIVDETHDVTAVRELFDRFREGLHNARELLALRADGQVEEARARKAQELHPFLERVVKKRIESITAEESLELDRALDGLLLSMGTTPWIAWIGPAQLASARVTLSEIRAAHETRSALLSQAHRLAEFLAMGGQTSEMALGAAAVSLDQALATWGRAADTYRRTSGEEAPPYYGRFATCNAEFQTRVARVLDLARSGQLATARIAAQREIKPFLDTELLAAVDTSLVVEMDEFREMLGRIRTSMRAAGGIGIAIAIAILLFALALFVSMARPMLHGLNQLRAGTEIIGAGNLEHRVNLRSNDELGQLGAHFDAMAQKLSEQVARRKALEEELLRNERLATLGQVIATVSHEIRNPLGTIHTALHSLRRRLGDAGEPVTKTLDRAERSIVRCDTIIEELLDYIRARKLDCVETPLDDWLAGIVDDYAVPKQIAVTRRLRSGATVMLDRNRVQGCVVNLLNNACQSILDPDSGPGAGTLLIETCRSASRIEVRVCDSGPGIDGEHLDKVFEPMFSTRTFGVGLGLPIVRKYMELHGGGAEITSRPGEGTVATLWFSGPKREEIGLEETPHSSGG